MNLIAVNSFLLNILICKTSATNLKSKFLLIESEAKENFTAENMLKFNDKILVPVPIHEHLDLKKLEDCQSSIYNFSFVRKLIPPEVAKTLEPLKEIEIITHPTKLNTTKYLEFYCWLNDIPIESTNCDNFDRVILFYLDYFNCKSIELLFKLFKIIRNPRGSKEVILYRFFVHLSEYRKLIRLINSNTDGSLELDFKLLFYGQEIVELLVSGTYDISFSYDSCCGIRLRNSSKEKNKSYVRIIKLNDNDIPKIKIKIYSSVLEPAILKFRERTTNKLLYQDSLLEICNRLVEALEFLATKHQLSKSCITKGFFYFKKIKDSKLFLLDSPLHCKLIANGYAYSFSTVDVYMRGDVLDSKEVINAIKLANESELVLVSKVCMIKNQKDIDSIFQISEKVNLIFEKDQEELKIRHKKIKQKCL